MIDANYFVNILLSQYVKCISIFLKHGAHCPFNTNLNQSSKHPPLLGQLILVMGPLLSRNSLFKIHYH